MIICFAKTEGHTFTIYNKNEKIIMDKENCDIQMDLSDSDGLTIKLDVAEKICNLMKWKQELSLKQWVMTFFIFFTVFLYDMFCVNIKRLADFVTPLSESYYIDSTGSGNTNRCELTYYTGRFEILSHQYIYPYMMVNGREKLKCKFELNLTALETSFFCAKLYYFFLIIPIALVCGIGGGAIWHSNFAIFEGIVISALIYFVSMNIYLNRRKRKLILQLTNELK